MAEGRIGEERKQFAQCLAVLSTLKRKEPLSAAEASVYDVATADIPMPLLQVTVSRLVQARMWFPTVAEIREAADLIRGEQRAAQKYDGCEDCNRGWKPVGDGGRLVARCDCWTRHQQKLSALGLNGPVTLALPTRTWTETEA